MITKSREKKGKRKRLSNKYKISTFTFTHIHTHNMNGKSGLQFSVGFKLSAAEAVAILLLLMLLIIMWHSYFISSLIQLPRTHSHRVNLDAIMVKVVHWTEWKSLFFKWKSKNTHTHTYRISTAIWNARCGGELCESCFSHYFFFLSKWNTLYIRIHSFHWESNTRQKNARKSESERECMKIFCHI